MEHELEEYEGYDEDGYDPGGPGVHGYEVEVQEIEHQPTVSISGSAPAEGVGALLARMLSEVSAFIDVRGVLPAGPPFSIYHDLSPQATRIECGVPLAEPLASSGSVVASELPGGRAVVTWHRGPYESLSDTYRVLERWMQENGVMPAGPPRAVYWTDPTDQGDPSNWTTQVVWPIK